MWPRWNIGSNDFDDMLSTLNQLRTYMDKVFDDASTARVWEGRGFSGLGGWPRANLADTGASISLTAEVPGLTEKDIKVSLNQDVLTLSGQRPIEAPKGYSTHRQERPSVEFSRSFSLPCRVNPEHATAAVKNGILTVTLEKAADAMPRQISVKAA